jgi:hypothetical protein
VNAGLAPIDNGGGLQQRQVLEPEARCFGFAMPELPRLDNLVRLAYLAADDADGVLYGDAFNRRIHEGLNEIQGALLATVRNLLCEVAGAGYRQIGAGRVGNHQVPSADQMIENVTSQVVRAGILCREQIAAPSIMPKFAERPTHNPGKFTGYQNLHFVPFAFLIASI